MSSTGDQHATARIVSGAVVRDAAGRILLVCRAAEGTWGLPGGGVKVGESWADAAIRECLEETGWHIDLQDLLGVYSDPATQVYRYPNGRLVHFYGVVFTARAARRSGLGDGEATDVDFFAPHALRRPLFRPDEPVLRDALNAGRRPHFG